MNPIPVKSFYGRVAAHHLDPDHVVASSHNLNQHPYPVKTKRLKKGGQKSYSYEKETREKCIRFPLEFPRRLLGPTTCWKTFYRQKEAFDFLTRSNEDLRVIGYETDRQEMFSGQRLYLVTSWPVFWHYYRQLDPSKKHHYEIIPEGHPCKLYFDLEFQRESNPQRDGKQMVDTLIKFVCAWLKACFAVNSQDVLNLDASTSAKFSCHLIFTSDLTVFQDNCCMGNFLRYIFDHLTRQVRREDVSNDPSQDKGTTRSAEKLSPSPTLHAHNSPLPCQFSSPSQSGQANCYVESIRGNQKGNNCEEERHINVNQHRGLLQTEESKRSDQGGLCDRKVYSPKRTHQVDPKRSTDFEFDACWDGLDFDVLEFTCDDAFDCDISKVGEDFFEVEEEDKSKTDTTKGLTCVRTVPPLPSCSCFENQTNYCDDNDQQKLSEQGFKVNDFCVFEKGRSKHKKLKISDNCNPNPFMGNPELYCNPPKCVMSFGTLDYNERTSFKPFCSSPRDSGELKSKTGDSQAMAKSEKATNANNGRNQHIARDGNKPNPLKNSSRISQDSDSVRARTCSDMAVAVSSDQTAVDKVSQKSSEDSLSFANSSKISQVCDGFKSGMGSDKAHTVSGHQTRSDQVSQAISREDSLSFTNSSKISQDSDSLKSATNRDKAHTVNCDQTSIDRFSQGISREKPESDEETMAAQVMAQFTTKELRSLVVKNKDGDDTLFCDLAVYSKNRNFRLFQSSKLGKQNPLVVSDQSRIGRDWPQEKIFYASLITHLSSSPSLKLLEFQTDSFGHVASATRQSSVSGRRCHGSKLTVDSKDCLQGYGCTSPYTEVDSYIEGLVGGEGRGGVVRHWTYFRQTETIIYDIAGYRWCGNIGRQHRSNNIMYVVDLPRAVYYQKCYDPDCQRVAYKSQEEELPPHCLPWHQFGLTDNSTETTSEEDHLWSPHEVSKEDSEMAFQGTAMEEDLLIEAVQMVEDGS